jgi:uncharacterized protein YbaP (TraB family)
MSRTTWHLVLAIVVAATLSIVLPDRASAQATAAASCPPQATPLDAPRLEAGLREAQDHGFLWRIAKDGRTSYLYGTIHAARPAWMFPGPQTLAALRASDVLALELNLLDPDVQARLVKAAIARPDEALPPALVARIERRLVAECVEAAPWRSFAPEFQVAALAALAARRDGLDPSYAIDLVLAVVATGLGKTMASLETPEAQIAALRMPTRQETLDFVTDGLDELDAGRTSTLIQHIAKAWTDSDLAELEAYERWCECLNTPAERASMKRLLDDRNTPLARAVDALHAGGRSVFAAVGSLHLIGPRGVPALLRQRGYAVEPVPLARR